MALYNSTGDELLAMVFNMTGATDRNSWYQLNRLISSPYDDIFTEPQTYFSIEG